MEKNKDIPGIIKGIYKELESNKKVLKNLKDIIDKEDTLDNELLDRIYRIYRSFKFDYYQSHYYSSNVQSLTPQSIKDIIRKSYIDDLDQIKQRIDELHEHYNSNVNKNIKDEYKNFCDFVNHVYLSLEESMQRIRSYYQSISK